MSQHLKSLNLPWHQANQYWICILPRHGFTTATISEHLTKIGMQEAGEGDDVGFLALAPQHWHDRWQEIYGILAENKLTEGIDAAVLSGDVSINPEQISMARRPLEDINKIAENLWLGEALIADRLLCYMQPVMHSKDKVFGYESFARVQGEDGKVIGGFAIVNACKALKMEYALDRQLHVEAVKTFATSNFNGSLFVNFFPGFIQRPEKYLEGLTESVQEYDVLPRNIVLDITKSEASHDRHHIKSIVDYCRKKGYAIALDDIESVSNAHDMVHEIEPDFVKIDTKIAGDALNEKHQQIISEIVRDCHSNGSLVIAEGVETEEMFTTLKGLGVDLFQGYYFSPPVAVEEIQQKGQASA